MKKKKIITLIIAIVAIAILLIGCRESDRVSSNISKEADNFNVVRRLSVINARTDKPMLEMIGRFSISNNAENELEIICEVEDGVYKKHFVYLNDYTMYVVEDITGAEVSPYQYELNFLPEMLPVFDVTSND